MSNIIIENLTFSYNNYGEDVFQDISLTLDTDWKLGLIGRNGRGKTTFLKILNKELIASGKIISNVQFEYFPLNIHNKNIDTINIVKNEIAPFTLWEQQMDEYSTCEEKIEIYSDILEKYIYNDGFIIEEMIKKEVMKMGIDSKLLYRKFDTLSLGEQTKMLLISLFLRKNYFLLIDEPTNHLDIKGREQVANYISSKSGFIVVSHDREFIDKVCDHILSINKSNIEIQKGDYSSWQLNKDINDNFEIAENDRLNKDIDRLKKTANEKKIWSNKLESTKIGSGVYDRGYVGHKSAKMMKRAKVIENRQNKAIQEKSKLLHNIERNEALTMNIDNSKSQVVLDIKNLSIKYDNRVLFENLNFCIEKGECLWLQGNNGTGKSSVIKLIMGENIEHKGSINCTKNISYINQDTSFLANESSLDEFIYKNKLDGQALRNNLFKLGFERTFFDKEIKYFSQGQKKKLLIAKSLTQKADLYIWDEPLNFIDIITRGQLEKLIMEVRPTMLIVEHDLSFMNKIAKKIIKI